MVYLLRLKVEDVRVDWTEKLYSSRVFSRCEYSQGGQVCLMHENERRLGQFRFSILVVGNVE